MGGLVGSGGGRSQSKPIDNSGALTLVNNSNEQTVYESTLTTVRRVSGSLDLAALAGAGSICTVTCYEKVDGATYRMVDQMTFTVGTSTLHPKWEYMVKGNTKVTAKMDVAESVNRNLPFTFIEYPQV